MLHHQISFSPTIGSGVNADAPENQDPHTHPTAMPATSRSQEAEATQLVSCKDAIGRFLLSTIELGLMA